MIMSGGQYELKRRERAMNNQSQSGLELDVIDHYNGSERSVRTLSGGESFQRPSPWPWVSPTRSSPWPGESAWSPCLWTRDLALWMSPPWSRRCRLWRG